MAGAESAYPMLPGRTVKWTVHGLLTDFMRAGSSGRPHTFGNPAALCAGSGKTQWQQTETNLPGRVPTVPRLVSLLLLLFQAPDLTPAAAREGSAAEWQKGITFTHLYRPHNNLLSERSRQSLEHLRSQVGAEWIALNPFGYQRDVDDPNVLFGGDPPDAHLRHAIAGAHELGLKVMLKPHIWLHHQSAERWRGTIAMKTEEDWEAWFRSYGNFILHYAAIAQAEGVEIFCIGVELARTAIEREQDWRALVAEIRKRYRGRLVYAANWWQEYDRIGFWDALDYIGVNAFFPLSDVPDPSAETLRANAEAVAGELALLHQRTGKPVLFTEVGFKSTRGTSMRPWLWPRRFEPEIDLEAQSRCYEAVLQVFWSKPWFSGMYWWKWFSDLDRGGASHPGFTPRRKPAESVLAEWYRKPRPR